jgi:hypothetical protein
MFESYAVKNLFGFLGVLYSMSAHDPQPKYHVTYNEDGVTKCNDTMKHTFNCTLQTKHGNILTMMQCCVDSFLVAGREWSVLLVLHQQQNLQIQTHETLLLQ